jgi:hypothetical protein
MRDLIDVKSIFRNHLEDVQRERQIEARERVENFFKRHRNVVVEEDVDRSVNQGRILSIDPRNGQ